MISTFISASNGERQFNAKEITELESTTNIFIHLCLFKLEEDFNISAEMAIETKVENMVSAITLDQKIDLKHLSKTVSGVEYNPENFPGLVYRIHEPRVAMLVFSSGKVICTGARSIDDVDAALIQLKKKLGEADIKVEGEPLVEVQNIVASSDLGFKVNLDLLAVECINTEYEPEQFPGLVFRLEHPKTVMLIFHSGKMIITGAKTEQDIHKSAENTKKEVLSYNARM
ncbi:TATA-box-binding protein [Candidatus Altiarchaeota archaeon]